MNVIRPTRAGSGALLAVIVTAACASASFAGSAVSAATPFDAASKPVVRLAFNASGLLPSSNSQVLPEQSALADIKEIQALREAADAGSARAQLDLGLHFEIGRGVTRDLAEALKWLRRAADQGYDEAQYLLGCCYNGDDGFPRNAAEAARWWGKAADRGYADAQYCLGLSYFTGEGVAKDLTAAANWWKKAAAQDQASAQYFLGLSYSRGLGVAQNEEQAVYWLRKAADRGNDDALAALKKLGKDPDLPSRKQSAELPRRDNARQPATG